MATTKRTVQARARIQTTSQEQLFNMFLSLYPQANKPLIPELDQTKLRYILYARRSTDEDNKQVRSPEQQIEECLKYIKKKKIIIDQNKDILIEKASAKISENRPIFTSMLEMITQGKYDGIIAWHPDRLSRNMKEAGIIIDMLDKFEIKDLIFPTAPFENTPSGKMMLGILFVMAKEYTDKLSLDSTRGIGDSVNLGKQFRVKHGYYRDKQFYMRPDGKNFELLREAFNMRLRGVGQSEIIKYLNDNNYHKRKIIKDEITGAVIGQPEVLFKMNDSTLSRIFSDPFYAGIVKFGQKRELVIILKDKYDFVPLITTDDFLKLNPNIKDKYKFMSRATNYGKGNFLKGKVQCVCGSIAYHDRGNNAVKYMRCKNRKCKAPSKFTNIKNVIFKGAANYLRSIPNSLIEGNLFPRYQVNFQLKVKQEETILKKKLDDIRGSKISTKSTLDKLDDDITKTKSIAAIEILTDKMKALKDKLQSLDIEELDTKKKIKDLNRTPLTMKRFSELITKLPDWIENSKNFDQICYVVGSTFTNFKVDGKKVLDYELNQDFELLFSGLNLEDFADGDATGNRTRIDRLRICCPNR